MHRQRFKITPVKVFIQTKHIITKDEHMADQALVLLGSDVADFAARENAFKTLQKIYLTASEKIKRLIETHCEEACVVT